MQNLLKPALAAASVPFALASLAGAVVTQTSDPSAITPDLTIDFAGVPDTDFTDAISMGPVDLNPFVPATATAVGMSSFSGDFEIDNEAFDIFLDDGNIEEVTFSFDTPLTAFGADFSGQNAPPSIAVTIDGQTFDVADDAGGMAAFQGFVSDTPFTDVTFGFGGAATFDLFTIDNLVVTFVPEPATASLAAVAGLALLRRRRN